MVLDLAATENGDESSSLSVKFKVSKADALELEIDPQELQLDETILFASF